MLRKLVIELKGSEEKRHGYFMGSLMQGVLMERIDPGLAGRLHENERHPYSQFVTARDQKVRWQINAIGEEIGASLFRPFLDPDFQEITLDHRDETFQIISRSESSISESDLVEQYYFGECDRYLHLRFLTPTSFKQNGQYCIFPTVRLIMQSLMMKHDASSTESTVFSEDILDDLERYCSIVRYQLKSVSYPLSGSRIPSFIGSIVIKVRGPQQMANFVRFLAEYGQYTGIGIKTGMGMGAYIIEENRQRKEAV